MKATFKIENALEQIEHDLKAVEKMTNQDPYYIIGYLTGTLQTVTKILK